jgi:brefeldin A-resistance guanine nucleotide exchange factor 1
VYERDPSGMGETRLKSATLLCKVFLQFVVRLAEGGEGEKEGEVVGGVFVRVLDKLERFMRGERDLLVSCFTYLGHSHAYIMDI